MAEQQKKKKLSPLAILGIVLFLGFCVMYYLADESFNKAREEQRQDIESYKKEEIQKKAIEEQKRLDSAWQQSKAGQICSKHLDWAVADCEKLASGEHIIWIGMTYDMLVESYGSQPDSANPSNYGSGTQWQWCWHNMKPSCFYDRNDDKVIDSYN